MRWQEEKTLQDVELRDKTRPETGFLSWPNYIKKHKDNSAKRYEVAQQFLPWPLGFKESVLALRAIIRDKKKADEDFESELLSLYKLAAWESFCPKYCETLQEPGFKVFDQIPGGTITALPIDYQQLGYKQLKLIIKTDAKMLVSLYGEPKQHTTLNQLFAEAWHQAEIDYSNRLKQQGTEQQVSTIVSDILVDKSVIKSTDQVADTVEIVSAQKPSAKIKYGLNTASKKYDANGQVIIPRVSSTDKPKKSIKVKVSQKAASKTLSKKSKSAQTIAKTKQLSGLMVQALRDRELIKERVLNGSFNNIKRTLAKRKLVVFLGASCLIVTRRGRSR